jgi:hypothetical protein
MNHPDPMLDGVGRLLQVDDRTLDENLAFVLLVQAIEDLHQGRLPGSVFAEQGVNFARVHVEVDAVVRQHPGESFGDSPHL